MCVSVYEGERGRGRERKRKGGEEGERLTFRPSLHVDVYVCCSYR